jgi:GDPmannose 4,6-dehydratase
MQAERHDVKRALITGITGQDGSYLAEFLLNKGYEVHGVVRRVSGFNTDRIDHIHTKPHEPESRLFLHYGDLTDSETIAHIIYTISPDEVYHLAAQSHVGISFDMPEYTGNITSLGTTRILEAIRRSGKDIKFYQASSSEMFGVSSPTQNEASPFYPRSPYAASKVYAYWMTVNYRQGYDLFACNGIFFNHESPRRGRVFVTRKITSGIADIIAGRQSKLYLGNLRVKKDWGYAPEYIELMWKMMQDQQADDYVVGTGQAMSVEDFLKSAFEYAGLDIQRHVCIDKKYLRPTETEDMIADSKKANKVFNWEPKIKAQDLVKIMVDADMRAAGLKPIGEGDSILVERFPDKWWSGD